MGPGRLPGNFCEGRGTSFYIDINSRSSFSKQYVMSNNSDKSKNPPDKDSLKPLEKWKDKEKSNMGNDVSSEIKIANAGGELEGGDNKQWHMDQGDFDESEKKDFENTGGKKEK